MKKLGRIIFTLIFALLGVGSIIVGAVLLTQGRDWIAVVFTGALVLFGIGLIAAGWAIARGARLKDILEDVFLGMP